MNLTIKQTTWRHYFISAFATSIIITTLYIYRKNNSNSVSPFISEQQSTNTRNQICHPSDATKYLINNDEAKCIDGSSPAYYMRSGFGDGADKWIVFFEGGGWCYDLEACNLRAKTILGSSKSYKQCMDSRQLNFYISRSAQSNPMMYNWNTVLVKYCDGSSYSGDSKQSYQGKYLYFRGKQNRDAIILSLLTSKGMNAAAQVVIAGCSAGGLGVYMGIDQISDLIQQHNHSIYVRGLADSGYFLDYSSDFSWRVTHMPQGKDDAVTGGKMDYAGGMRRVFNFTGMESGVHPDCVRQQKKKKFGSSSAECVFAKNLAPHIRTPLFALQPQFDQWQILHVLSKNFTAQSVNSFGATLRASLQTSLLYNGERSNPGHGAFVDSCAHHCTSCSNPAEDTWNGQRIVSTTAEVWGADDYPPASAKISSSNQNLNGAQAFERWYKQSLLVSGSSRKGSLNATARQAAPPLFFFQNRTFPCYDCCLCTVYK